jgi:hypothetical protein
MVDLLSSFTGTERVKVYSIYLAKHPLRKLSPLVPKTTFRGRHGNCTTWVASQVQAALVKSKSTDSILCGHALPSSFQIRKDSQPRQGRGQREAHGQAFQLPILFSLPHAEIALAQISSAWPVGRSALGARWLGRIKQALTPKELSSRAGKTKRHQKNQPNKKPKQTNKRNDNKLARSVLTLSLGHKGAWRAPTGTIQRRPGSSLPRGQQPREEGWGGPCTRKGREKLLATPPAERRP